APLSLHDALPIWRARRPVPEPEDAAGDLDAAGAEAERKGHQVDRDRPQRQRRAAPACEEDDDEGKGIDAVRAISLRVSLPFFPHLVQSLHVYRRLAALLVILQRFQDIDRSIEIALDALPRGLEI